MTWGVHCILNAGRCSPGSIRSAANIRRFAKTLVKDIQMVPYGQPKLYMFGSGNKKGYTLVQLIETSNITAHFVEETNDMYLDVFSCKDYDAEVVKSLVEEYFEPGAVHTQVLRRQAP